MALLRSLDLNDGFVVGSVGVGLGEGVCGRYGTGLGGEMSMRGGDWGWLFSAGTLVDVGLIHVVVGHGGEMFFVIGVACESGTKVNVGRCVC